MAGVEILAENAIMTTQYSFVWNGFTIFSYILAVCCIIAMIFFIIDDELIAIAPFLLAIFLIITGTGIANVKGMEEVYSHTEYLATIEETVPLVEFNQKYEIIEQIGELYRIKERAEDGGN